MPPIQQMMLAATAIIAGGSLVVTTSAVLPSAQVGFAYFLALQAAFGVSPYTWNLVSQTGSNTWALSSTGLLTGTPSVADTDTITVHVVDSASNTSSNVTLSVTVNTIGGTLTLTSASTLPIATNNGGYFYKLAVSGGTAPYTFKVGTITGSTGTQWQTQCTYDSGYLYGAPVTNGADSIPVTVTDAKGNTASKTFSITVNSHLSIQGTSLESSADQPLPAAMNGNKYKHTLIAAGGTGASYTWSILSGTLPAGLSLSSAGVITGTPTITGQVSAIVVKVQDSGANTATQSFSLNVSQSLNVSRPAWNSNASNGFFVKSGQFYDPNGAPFRVRGLNQVHYDQGSATTWGRTQSAAVRFGLFNGASDATQAAVMNTQHIATGQFPIVTRFGNITTPPAQTGNASGSSSLALLGAMTVDWVNNFSVWSTYMAKIAINVANEWGNYTNSPVYRDAYSAVQANISNATGTTITINTVSATNPFAGTPVGLTYMYLKGATGLSNRVVAVSATGGSSGAWTVTTSTSLAGWTSGGVLYAGAVGMIRAVGYTCPIFVDSAGGAGQDPLNPLNYGAAIQASDPLQNCIFTVHMYGNFTPNACPITNITKAASAVVTYSNFNLPWGPTSTNPFRGTYANSGSNNNFISATYIAGVAGMTQINNLNAAISPQLGTGNSFSSGTGINSSGFGTYTSGGWIYDQNYFAIAIAKLSALASQGICVAIMEFGPPDPPLAQAPNTTNITPSQVIRTCEYNGIGWCAWAFDDNPGNNTFGAQLALSTYAKPSDLSYFGIDVILNPSYGVTALSTPPSSLL